jgi:hypothetical protein
MSYINNPFLTEETDFPLNTSVPIVDDELNNDSGYESVRFGEPTGSVDFEKVRKDREVLIKHYYNHGYEGIPYLDSLDFKQHVGLFKAQLDLWENFSKEKVFSKDEIYIRCLSEGPSFTEFIKKSRSTTLRGLTSVTDTDLDEEFYHPDGYTGYNSIIHERYLIHWDDRESIDDVKYAFMPATGETFDFEECFSDFLKSLRLGPSDFDAELDVLQSMKNTMMYDCKTRKTHLMREFWMDDINISQPYFAKRSVVLTFPGSTRDTGVGDPSTILKVKMINKICRTILEACPNSANAPSRLANMRYLRVLNKSMYLHLDFKKYGLAFPRALDNIALRLIGERFKIDLEEFYINEFLLEINGETYLTERGSCLGWIDCLHELCVHAILHNLSKTQGMKFDWIAFNDDVEISFNAVNDAQTKSEMVRDVVLSRFNIMDVLVSINKTYASRSSIFLERYARFQEEYNLDMYKEQLTVKAFAQSLVTKHTWKAKIYFAAAWQWTKNDYASSRCIATAEKEFGKHEYDASLFCGGWFMPVETGLDRSLEGMVPESIYLGCELSKIQLPDVSSKRTKASTNEEIEIELQKKYNRLKTSSDARDLFSMEETIEDVNFTIDNIEITYMLRSRSYEGGNQDFLDTYTRLMDSIAHLRITREPP